MKTFMLMALSVMGAGGVANAQYPGQYQQPVNPYYQNCMTGWQRLDGGMNSGRQGRCLNVTFASCLSDYVMTGAGIDSPKVDRCAKLQDSNGIIGGYQASSTQDYNSCVSAWRRLDGGINSGREDRCMNFAFAPCMASYLAIGNVSQPSVDRCAYNQDHFNPYAQFPASNQNYDTCIQGWRSFDGGLNSGREDRCNDDNFSGCVSTYMRSYGRVGQNEINACAYGQPAPQPYPQPYPQPQPQPQPQPYPQPAPQPYPQPAPQPYPQPQPAPLPPAPRPQPAPPAPRPTCEIHSGANASGVQFFRVMTSSGAIIGNFATTQEATAFAMSDPRCFQ